MKRDMDLLRDILLRVEYDAKTGISDDHTDGGIADHVQQLLEEGLVEGKVVRNREGIPCHAVITRLTSAGHDFLDAIRNESSWVKTKAYITKNLPGWTIRVIKEVAERGISLELQQSATAEATDSYCHECGGDRNHEILKSHSHEDEFPDRLSGEMTMTTNLSGAIFRLNALSPYHSG